MRELIEYGWTDFFAQHFVASDTFVAARVVAEHRSLFRVQTESGERSARIAGKFRHAARTRADLPAVGDWVATQLPPVSGEATIHRVLPRRSKFSRKAAGQRTEEQVVAANVDVVWIVSSLDQDFSLRRIERYLSLAWESGASPVIVLTKSDQCGDVRRCVCEAESVAVGTPVHAISSHTREGVPELRPYLKNHATIALLGSSGVGKSTLINALADEPLQATREVRKDGKGRHTTIHRQLLRLPDGGLIIDTPGMRELQLWDSSEGLADTFADIEQIATACRFSDCRHAGEPGCAVQAAVLQGRLSADRLVSFQKLQRELDYLDRKQDALAQLQEKRRIKSIMKSLRHHPKYE